MKFLYVSHFFFNYLCQYVCVRTSEWCCILILHTRLSFCLLIFCNFFQLLLSVFIYCIAYHFWLKNLTCWCGCWWFLFSNRWFCLLFPIYFVPIAVVFVVLRSCRFCCISLVMAVLLLLFLGDRFTSVLLFLLLPMNLSAFGREWGLFKFILLFIVIVVVFLVLAIS